MSLERLSQEIEPRCIIPEIEKTVYGAMGALAVSQSEAVAYVEFLVAPDMMHQNDPEVLAAADRLRQAYQKNLQKFVKYADKYDYMEQVMLGHIFGRTRIDKPLNIVASVELISGDGYQSKTQALGAVASLSSGLKKYARRVCR